MNYSFADYKLKNYTRQSTRFIFIYFIFIIRFDTHFLINAPAARSTGLRWQRHSQTGTFPYFFVVFFAFAFVVFFAVVFFAVFLAAGIIFPSL